MLLKGRLILPVILIQTSCYITNIKRDLIQFKNSIIIVKDIY